jgi:hypothetical protein
LLRRERFDQEMHEFRGVLSDEASWDTDETDSAFFKVGLPYFIRKTLSRI